MEFFFLTGMYDGQDLEADYFGNKHGIKVLSEITFIRLSFKYINYAEFW